MLSRAEASDRSINSQMMFSGSKKELLDLIKREGTVTTNEATEKLELAKSTLREHLLQLENEGYLKKDYDRTGKGRPSLCYELTPKGHSLYPSYESNLMKEFLNYLKSRGQEEVIRDFFSSFWKERLKEAELRMKSTSGSDPEKKLEALSQMLEEEGFMPEFQVDEQENKAVIKECNCPFSEVVKETDLPCQLEEMFFKELFGSQAERISHIGSGDYSCSYRIPL